MTSAFGETFCPFPVSERLFVWFENIVALLASFSMIFYSVARHLIQLNFKMHVHYFTVLYMIQIVHIKHSIKTVSQ